MNKRKMLAVVLALLWIAATMVSCSSGSNNAAESMQSVSDEAVDSSYGDVAPESAYESGAGETGGSSLSGSVNTGNIDPEKQKIIRNARITMQSKEFIKSVEDITNRAAELGGYIESSEMQGQNYEGSCSAELMIRIPYQNLGTYLNSVRGFGEMISEGIQTQDVSDAYFDAKARIKSLQIQLERYEAIMAQSAKLEDILALEKEIAQVRYEIESLQGSINSWDDKVSFSSVQISIHEVSDYVPATVAPATLGERVGNAFRSSWRTVWSVTQSAIVLIVALLPLILLFALVLAIVMLVRRRKESKQQIKRGTTEASEEDAKK